MPPRRSARRSLQASAASDSPAKAVDSEAALSPLAFPAPDTVAAVLSRGPTNAKEPVAELSDGNADVSAATGLATPRASQPETDQPEAGPSRVRRPVKTYSRAHRRASMLKKPSPTPSSDSSLSEPPDGPPAQATSPASEEEDEEREPPSDESESEDSDNAKSKKRKAPDDDYAPQSRAPKRAPRKTVGKKAKARKRSESPDLATVSLFDVIDGKVDKEGRLIKKVSSKKNPTKRSPKKKDGTKQTPAKPRTPTKATGATASRARSTAKNKAMPNPTPDQTSPGTPESDTVMPWSSLTAAADDDDDDDKPMDLMAVFERKQCPSSDSDASSVLTDLPPAPPEPEVFRPSKLPPGAKIGGTCLVKDMHEWRPALLEEFHPAQTEEEARRHGDRFTVRDRVGKLHQRRVRKAILFLEDEAIADCLIAEFRVREESPTKSSRKRPPTPDLDLPPAEDTPGFCELDSWKQIVVMRPHLSDILNEQYPPAQWRVDAFFRSPSARDGLNRKVSYGGVPDFEVAREIVPELERWALGAEARREATPRRRNARSRSDSTPATEPRPPATGSERWESLSGQDRRDYVHLVLLPEAIIEMCVRTFGFLEPAEPAPEDDNRKQADGPPDDAGTSATAVQDDDTGADVAVDQELDTAQPAQPTTPKASKPDQNGDTTTAASEKSTAAVSGEPGDTPPPATASPPVSNAPDKAPPMEAAPVPPAEPAEPPQMEATPVPPAEPAEPPQTARVASPTPPATTSSTSPQPTPAKPTPTPSEPSQQPSSIPTASGTPAPAPSKAATAQQRAYDAACRQVQTLSQNDPMTDWAVRCTDINNAKRAMRRKLGLPEFDTVEPSPPDLELSWAGGRRRTKKNYKV